MKTEVFECVHYEYDYDDFGKYAMCHQPDSGCYECPSTYKYGMQFCPFYKKGKSVGKIEVPDYVIKHAKEFKAEMEAELNKRKEKALSTLCHLSKYS